MRSHLLAFAACLLFASASLVAADKTWTGGGGTGVTDWASGTNWGGVAPLANDSLIFPILTPSTLNKTASNSYVGGTAFGPITIDAAGYVLSGNLINLQGGIFLNGANTTQVAMPIQVDSPVAFTVSNANGILTLIQPISGVGGVIKSGSGSLILNGNNSYTGGTIIDGGLLQTGNNLTGPVQIRNGFLIGTGTVDGITSLNQISAGVSPGTNSANGTLTSDGNVTLFSNDELYFTIGTTSDKLVVNGEVNLGLAGINLTVQSTPALNTDVVLIENDGLDPVVYDAAVPSNYLYDVTINTLPYRLIMVGGTNRNDVVLRRVPTSTSSVTLSSSNLTITHGTSVTFTATVTGAVAGATVSFWDGNEFIGNNLIAGGQAQISTSALRPGSRKITAFYEGNGSTAPARSAILTQTVNGVPTSTGLVVSPTPTSAPDAMVTMTATTNTVPPSGSPAGSVTFYDNGLELGTVPLAANQAVYTTTALKSGSHSLGAIFNPANPPSNSALASASATVAHTVTGTATTTTLSALPVTTAVAGTNVTFTATVSGGATTGSVVFSDGAATLGTVAVGGGGTAAFSTSGLAAGTHSIAASYLGTTTHGASTASPALSYAITAAPDGSGSPANPNVELSGGCGLGSGVGALILGLLMLMGLRLRRH